MMFVILRQKGKTNGMKVIIVIKICKKVIPIGKTNDAFENG